MTKKEEFEKFCAFIGSPESKDYVLAAIKRQQEFKERVQSGYYNELIKKGSRKI